MAKLFGESKLTFLLKKKKCEKLTELLSSHRNKQKKVIAA
jgi:hypothetical protein